MSSEGESVCALVSGGLDSGVMLWELSQSYARCFPVYVRCGLVWERAELHWLRKFLKAIGNDAIQSLTVLELPIRDVYQSHWSVSGDGVPGYDADNPSVYLPGRNLILLSKAATFCALNGIHTISFAILGHNPFPDATRKFFDRFEQAASVALSHSIKVIAPFAHLTKAEVIRLGKGLPLHLTFSCMNPQSYRHCGDCSKCAERIKAFAEAGVEDRTIYATPKR